MFKHNFLENFCIGSGGVGTVWATVITDIKEVMNVVFLGIQLTILTIGACVKIYKMLKEKDKHDD